MGRSVAVVTSARSDFGPLKPVMRMIQSDQDLELIVYATGMHFSDGHGHTVDEIIAEGFGDELVEVPAAPRDDSSAAAADAMGRGVSAFAEAYREKRPDIVVVMGDRFDMLPAVVAAVPFNIPVAHLSGGEITEGVIDDALRHAATKLSHLHFASMEPYARRLRQMGEEPWRIAVVGEPGLDMVNGYPNQSRIDFLAEFGFSSDRPVSLFTYHPETLSQENTGRAIGRVLNAAKEVETQILFTYSNYDPGSTPIIEATNRFAEETAGCAITPSLGRERFFNALAHCDCMVGNSSAGIVEGASFSLPVVDIGTRQKGRLAPPNVIHAPEETAAIAAAWQRALSSKFREGLDGLDNPYGDGHAAARIVERLKSQELSSRLVIKRFFDAGPDVPGQEHSPL